MSARKPPEDRLPNWPRLLSEKLSAAYLSISVGLFALGVNSGLWPRPLRIHRRKLWDRKGLDARVDALVGIAITQEEIVTRKAAPPPRNQRKHVLR